MSRIGVIGAGKLGLPLALAMESKGHSVLVQDLNPQVTQILTEKKTPYLEAGVDTLLSSTKIRNVSGMELVKHSEIIFVVVQTPHDPDLDGSSPLTGKRKDFDYSHLEKACWDLNATMWKWGKSPLIVIVSTVLPGTIGRRIIPRFDVGLKVIYSPQFAAMGTVIEDFLFPEFNLIGTRNLPDNQAGDITLHEFYSTINEAPVLVTSIESAELAKCAYNTTITSRVVLSNTFMEIAHKVPGCDCDEVTEILQHATKRILSSRYMQGGLGDSGPCHPRDNLAMSHLANKLDLSSNVFADLMRTRESQTRWLALTLYREAYLQKLPAVILGKAYKPETNITAGSGALLLANILLSVGAEFLQWDPYVDGDDFPFPVGVYLIATKHEKFRDIQFPKGSVVFDPHRYLSEQEGVTLIPIGVGK